MSIALSALRQDFPPKAKWGVEDIPDLSGKVVIVTGGNSGVGKETVKALLQHNAKVYMAARSAEKAKHAIEELKAATGKDALFLQLDLADLRAVRKSAEEFLSKEKELHVLFNNAGVMSCPMDQLTAQGYDMQIGTNVLGHYFFTILLLPALKAASASGEKARVVNTSSAGAYFAPDFSFDSAKDGPARRNRKTLELYRDSKLGNVLFAREMARRYGDQIISTSVNPGLVKTNLHRHMKGLEAALVPLFLHAAPMGALTQLWAGVSSETADKNGQFLVPWARVGPLPPKSLDTQLAEKFWTWLEEQCQGF